MASTDPLMANTSQHGHGVQDGALGEPYKILVVGDDRVGKTSIIKRLKTGEFSRHNVSTTGADLEIVRLSVETGKIAELKIWDVAGSKRYRQMGANFYRGSHGVMYVFDITKKQTLKNIKTNWVRSVRDYVGNITPEVVVVGNKSDLNRDDVDAEDKQAKRWVEEICERPATFFAVSARDGQGIEKAFAELVYRIDSNDELSKQRKHHESVGEARMPWKKRKECCSGCCVIM